MLGKLSSKVSSAVSSISGSPARHLPPDHVDPGRAAAYVSFAEDLEKAGIPADTSDCITCDHPCPVADDGSGEPTVAEAGQIWDGKGYDEYVMDKYGELGDLPRGHDCDWDSELAGSGQPPRGRVVVISTGKSNWERDHTDERGSFAHELNGYLRSLPRTGSGKGPRRTVDFNTRPPLDQFIVPKAPISETRLAPPTLFSSSLLTQSDDPVDQTVLVFPDWKVVMEVENSKAGAAALNDDVLQGGLGRAGKGPLSEPQLDGVGRKRSWVMPYRAVVLICSHKRRDNRCHIAAPLLRSAFITCLSKYDINVDETGQSLCGLPDGPLEELKGDQKTREAEVDKRVRSIEGVEGGNGGEVGIFNINHLGGHRYSGVLLVLFPSGAFVSYGRLSPHQIPRVVEETILKGRIVPGLLRAAAGVERQPGSKGFLSW